MDSPRGRIYQMLQVDEGRLALGESFVTHIDRCLGCLNCQTACPSGVNYGALLESSRAQIEQNFRRPWLQRKIREFFYGRVLPSFSKLSFWAKAGPLLPALGFTKPGTGNRTAEAARRRRSGRPVAADRERLLLQRPWQSVSRRRSSARPCRSSHRLHWQRRLRGVEPRHHSRANPQRHRGLHPQSAELLRCAACSCRIDRGRHAPRRGRISTPCLALRSTPS